MQISRFLSPKTFFYTTAHFVLQAVNTACLALIGYNAIRLWTDGAFDLIETAEQYPNEAEFADRTSLLYQVWGGTAGKTLVFLFGAFLCYERLIRSKSLARNITAPLVLAFVWTAGNAIGLFLPASDKAAEIRTCLSTGITWNEKNHECNVMDLEKRRMEKFLAELKAKHKKDFRPVYAPFYNPVVVHKPAETDVEQTVAKTTEPPPSVEAPVEKGKTETVKPSAPPAKILKKTGKKKGKKPLRGKIVKKTAEKKEPDKKTP